ncbi:carboxypeptidase regulatory-like domain-containing protein [Sorangium sp. So ce117]|uniref:carboxypeptidase regulatory-like domain-containing protein n=1 Tax=Sorangium sp. So ce117 TaxID=3133277 RepID=UPI003F5DB81A
MHSIMREPLRHALVFALALGAAASCALTPSEESGDEQTAESRAEMSPRELFSGTVIGPDGAPLGGAAVSVNDSVVSTDAGGYFELYTPRSDRYVIHTSKHDHVSASLIHTGLSLLDMEIKLRQAEVFPIDPTRPIAVTDSRGTRISIDAGALVDQSGRPATGPLTLNMHTYNLREEAMVGDMSGVDVSGNIVTLSSVGAFSAEFTDSGGRLYNLAPGETASIAMVVDRENPYFGDIPMWYYNYENGLWIEEGTGSVINGLATAQVSHFSAWNFDIKSSSPACIRLNLDSAYLDEQPEGFVQARVEVPPPWRRVADVVLNDATKGNVLYNLPPNTDVKVFIPKDQLYAVVNTGAPWGGVGVPPVGRRPNYYPACNSWLAVNGVPQVGTVSGTVSLQGRSNHSGAAVQAWKEGRLVGTAVTDAAGQYSLSVPPDTYSIKFSKSGYVGATNAAVSAAPGGTTTLGLVTLLAGDVDGSNCVDWANDVMVIGNAMGLPVGPEDPRDLDGDGNIDNADLSLAVANLGACDPSATPASSPAPPSGMRLWLRADAGVTSSVGKVSLWEDQSGNGINGSTPAASRQPSLIAGALNGKPVVRFEGAQSLGLTSPIQPARFTVFIVGKNSKTSEEFSVILGPGGSTPNNQLRWENGSQALFVGLGNSMPIIKTTIGDTRAYHALSTRYDGSTMTVYRNGGLISTHSFSTTGPWVLGQIGAWYSSYFMVGDLAEILVYDTALSEADRSSVNMYLRDKYALP